MKPAPALARIAAVVVTVLVLGLVLGRPDVVALAIPFAVGAVLALDGNRTKQLSLAARLEQADIVEEDRFAVLLTVTANVDLDAVTVQVAGRGVNQDHPAVVTAAPAGAPHSLRVDLVAPRWGRHEVGPFTVVAHGRGFLTSAVTVKRATIAITVQPRVAPFDHTAAVPHTRWLAGLHRARSIGPGGEFAGIRPYAPGDRPRRVNGKATARTGVLQVTTTHTERSADVTVVIDSTQEIGRPGDSSLDAAVRAAAGLVDHYLDSGDRVGLAEFGGHGRRLGAGSGRAHRARARNWLLDAQREEGVASAQVDQQVDQLPAGRTLAIVLSPLVDPASTLMLGELRRRGLPVVVIDTLPASVQRPPIDEVDVVAQRLWRLERRVQIHRLAEIGVPLVRWAGPDSFALVLRDLSRLSAAPRVTLR